MTSRPNNELRYEWRLSLEHERGSRPSTISAKLAALSAYETFTGNRPFPKLSRDQVAAFKEQQLTRVSSKTGEKLSPSTIVHTLEHCQSFFRWLEDTPEGRKLDKTAIAWFTASRADKERARAVPPRPVPQLDEAKAAFAVMPIETLLQRRDKSVLALLLLTALRADAVASLPIGAINLAENRVWQDARHVRTKFSKSYTVFFMPFVPEALTVLEAWLKELERLGFGANDPLFPRDMEISKLEQHGAVPAEARLFWAGSSQIRAICTRAFTAAGLIPYTPHVFRHMLTRHAMSLRLTAEDLVALSINLGHSDLSTTLDPYGRPTDERRAALIAGMKSSDETKDTSALRPLLTRLADKNPELAAQVMETLMEN
jgi:integrase